MGLVDPAGHAYPAVQSPLQLAVPSPGAAPYRPAAQAVHTVDPAKLYVPAGHTSAVALVDPAGQTKPALQGPEHADDVRPVVSPYTPAGQSVPFDVLPPGPQYAPVR